MTFLKYEQVPFEVVIIETSRTRGSQKFDRIDITDVSLKMAINQDLDDPTPLAETSGASWAKNTSTNTFTGVLNLNTALMNSYIGAIDKLPYFEIELTTSTGRYRALFETCSVRVGTLQTTTTSPDPSREYLTKDEMMGIFVPRIMGAGETITWRSPDGTIYRIFGVRDDGTPQDDTSP